MTSYRNTQVLTCPRNYWLTHDRPRACLLDANPCRFPSKHVDLTLTWTPRRSCRARPTTTHHTSIHLDPCFSTSSRICQIHRSYSLFSTTAAAAARTQQHECLSPPFFGPCCAVLCSLSSRRLPSSGHETPRRTDRYLRHTRQTHTHKSSRSLTAENHGRWREPRC